MGFYDVFGGGTGGRSPAPGVGGGVTPGQEPWKGPEPPTTITVQRKAKPLILAVSLSTGERLEFLAVMGAVLATGVAGQLDAMGFVQTTDGIVWVPNFGPIAGLDRLSIALENAGFDPTKCAVQTYIAAAVSGPSLIVHWRGHAQLAVRLVYGDVGNPKVYQGVHDLELSLASPMIFATEIKTFIGA